MNPRSFSIPVACSLHFRWSLFQYVESFCFFLFLLCTPSCWAPRYLLWSLIFHVTMVVLLLVCLSYFVFFASSTLLCLVASHVCVCVCVSQSVSNIHDSQIMFNIKQYAREAREAWEIWEAWETWQQGLSVVVRCGLQYEPSTTPVITSPVLFQDYCSTVPILQHPTNNTPAPVQYNPAPFQCHPNAIQYQCMLHLLHVHASCIHVYKCNSICTVLFA